LLALNPGPRICAEQYDFAVTLLLLENQYRYTQLDRGPQEDVFDRFSSGP